MVLAVDMPDPFAARRNERRAAGVAYGAHALHDGYTDLIYVLLPIWQAEFGLGYAALGLLRGLFSGSMAGLQIPAGMLGERIGIATILAVGTAICGLGFCLAGLSTGLPMLIVALTLGGIGSSTQHPLGSELIARTFAGPRSLKALGTYNFAGDIGKMTVPALGALMIAAMPWRVSLALLGGIGVVAAVLILRFMPATASATPVRRPEARTVAPAEPAYDRGFAVLFAVGVLDSAVRMSFLTFLPFMLTDKGAGLPTVGIALTLVFAGGAAGKLICAHLGARIGVIATVWLTETLTAAGILALLPLALEPALALLPVIGLALNGTSSVLYGSVPMLVRPERRSHAFGVFYTATIGSGAAAPVAFGFVGDLLGVPITLLLIAAVALLTLPLALILRPALTQRA